MRFSFALLLGAIMTALATDPDRRYQTADELRVAGRFLEEEGSLSDFLETVEET